MNKYRLVGKQLVPIVPKHQEKKKQPQSFPEQTRRKTTIFIAAAIVVVGIVMSATLLMKTKVDKKESLGSDSTVRENDEEVTYNPSLSSYTPPSSMRSIIKGGETLKTDLVTVHFRGVKSAKPENETEQGEAKDTPEETPPTEYKGI